MSPSVVKLAGIAKALFSFSLIQLCRPVDVSTGFRLPAATSKRVQGLCLPS